jgi:hypothetical protein
MVKTDDGRIMDPSAARGFRQGIQSCFQPLNNIGELIQGIVSNILFTLFGEIVDLHQADLPLSSIHQDQRSP